MAVVTPLGTTHQRARDLPQWLRPGDLLVVNTSATLPAALDVVRRGCTWGLHVSTELDDGAWVVELRRPDGRGPGRPEPGEVLRLPDGLRLRIDGPHPAGQSRLWRATTLPAVDRIEYLQRHGRPIRYSYLDGEWPLEDLQNVYAAVPGSAEMPSAGRPLTRELLVDADGRRGRRRAGRAAHRGVQPGVARAAAAGVVLGARLDGSAGRAHPRARRPGAWRSAPPSPGRWSRRSTSPARWSPAWAGRRWCSARRARRSSSTGLLTGLHETGRQPPRPAPGGRRAWARGAGVRRPRGRRRAAVPLARVRRLDAAAALTRSLRALACTHGVTEGGIRARAVGHRDRERRHAAPDHGDRRGDSRDRGNAPRAVRPSQGEGRPDLSGVLGRPAARPAGPGDGAVADPAGGGQDHDHRRPHRRAARIGTACGRLPARAVDGTSVRHEGRGGRRWLQPGRPDDRDQPALHRRLRRDRRCEQPAGRADRQPRAPRQRAGHRRAQRHLEARARRERPCAPPGRRRSRRPRQRIPPRGRVRHRGRVGADGDLLPDGVVGGPEAPDRRHRHRLHASHGTGDRAGTSVPTARWPCCCAMRWRPTWSRPWRVPRRSCTADRSPTSPTAAARSWPPAPASDWPTWSSRGGLRGRPGC